MIYPKVHGELETIAKINEGYSIARIGDGELKIMDGKGYSREQPNPALTKELRQVCAKPHEKCLVGIPTMDPKGTKYANWQRHKERFCKFLSPDVEYYSALITRPDCGQWMISVDYAKAIQTIWLGKSVTVIGCTGNKIAKAIQYTQDIDFIECPLYGAYAEIDRLEQAALDAGNELVIISSGPTASCLANRLAPKVQAVDLGSIGGFLIKMLHGGKWND